MGIFSKIHAYVLIQNTSGIYSFTPAFDANTPAFGDT